MPWLIMMLFQRRTAQARGKRVKAGRKIGGVSRNRWYEGVYRYMGKVNSRIYRDKEGRGMRKVRQVVRREWDSAVLSNRSAL
jgi:hypothetical protein